MLAFGSLLTGCGGSGESEGSDDSGVTQSNEEAESGGNDGSILSKDPSDYYDRNGLDFDLAGCLEGVYGMTDVKVNDLGYLLATTSKGDRMCFLPNNERESGESYISGGLKILRDVNDGTGELYGVYFPVVTADTRDGAMIIYEFEEQGEEFDCRITDVELEYMLNFLNGYDGLTIDECPLATLDASHLVGVDGIIEDFEEFLYDTLSGETVMHDPH